MAKRPSKCDAEGWEPLDPQCFVFDTREDGKVMVFSKDRNILTGAIVRQRAGKWMMRTGTGLLILNPAEIQRLIESEDYKRGSDLLSA